MIPPKREELEAALERFIGEELVEDPGDGKLGDPLAEGRVDSLGVEQLVEYVFEAWKIELRDEEIVEENFESVPALAALVASRF